MLLTAAVLLGAWAPATAQTAPPSRPPAGVAAPEPDPLKALTALDARWQRRFAEPAAAAPAFDAGHAFVPLRTGELVAVRLDTGAVAWRRALSTTHAPEAGGGLVFVASGTTIRALEPATGRTRWEHETPSPIAVPPYWDTGWLILSTESGTLVAYRADDGQEVWRRDLASPLAVTPAPALDRLYLGLVDGRLVSAALASGETTWTYTIQGRFTGILGLDDQVVFGTTENYVLSLDPRTGRERWRWRVGGDPAGPPAADAARIYVASLDNVLRALDRRNGNLRWTKGLTARPAGGPQRLENLLLLPYVSPVIGVFNPLDGTALFELTAAGEVGARPYLRLDARPTAPRLFAISRDGALQAFAPRFEPAPAPLAELPGTKVAP
ncbi:MAG: PQQ-binding-like beta-propeller repeat protein [Vicinamibacterales bacterium]